MISSASNTPGQPLPGLPAAGHKPAPASTPVTAFTQESLSAKGTDILRNALASTPEVRPEAVAKGQQLAADGNYPPRVIIEKLAELIAKTNDLTNQS